MKSRYSQQRAIVYAYLEKQRRERYTIEKELEKLHKIIRNCLFGTTWTKYNI